MTHVSRKQKPKPMTVTAFVTGGVCVLLGLLALLGYPAVGKAGPEAATAWFALGTLVAAVGAGYFAGKAARETQNQRVHATTPAFVELIPSGPVPQDVVGLKEAQGDVVIADGYEEDPSAPEGSKRVKSDTDAEAFHWVVVWKRVVRRSQQERVCRIDLTPTVGDLRTVIVHTDGKLIGLSIPLTNAGGGVAVIKDDDIALVRTDPDNFEIGLCDNAVAVNRNRVPPGATVRLSAVLRGKPEATECKDVELRVSFTDLHGLEHRDVVVRVQRNPHDTNARWFVTDITIGPSCKTS